VHDVVYYLFYRVGSLLQISERYKHVGHSEQQVYALAGIVRD
jgi:hypothetical protein